MPRWIIIGICAQGIPEVIFCQGKNAGRDRSAGSPERILAAGGPGLIASRADTKAYEAR